MRWFTLHLLLQKNSWTSSSTLPRVSFDTAGRISPFLRAGCLRPLVSFGVFDVGISRRCSCSVRSAPTVLWSVWVILPICPSESSGFSASTTLAIKARFCSLVKFRCLRCRFALITNLPGSVPVYCSKRGFDFCV